MFPSPSSTAQWPGKAIDTITASIPDKPPRDNRPIPGAQGVTPTTRRPAQTNGTLTTSASGPVPGVQRAASTKQRSANPPRQTRLPAKPADTPHKALREVRAEPGVQKATPTKHQPTNLPALNRVPARSDDILRKAFATRPVPEVQLVIPTGHQPVDTPGISGSGFKFADVLTPNNPPGLKVLSIVLLYPFANNPAILVPNVQTQIT